MNQISSPPPAADEVSGQDTLARLMAGLPRRTLAVALWLLPIVALANVAVLVWSLGTIDIEERLVAPHLLALAVLLVFVPMTANALRLSIWGRFLGLNLGFLAALRVVTGTTVANSVSPSASGGMPIRVLFLLSEGIEARRAISLVSFQAVEDAITLFGLVGIAATVSGFALIDFLAADPGFRASLESNLRLAGMIGIGLVLALALLGGLIGTGILGNGLRAWTVRKLRPVRRSAAMVVNDWGAIARKGKALALVNLAIAAVQWMVRFSIAGLVLAAFGTRWQPALFWLLQYLVQVISSTVPSPGGAGGAEAGFLLLFSSFVDRPVLLAAMSTWRLLFFYVPLIGAAVTFSILRRRKYPHILPARGDAPPLGAHMPAE